VSYIGNSCGLRTKDGGEHDLARDWQSLKGKKARFAVGPPGLLQ
jgi:hypothetical protein